MNQNGSAAVPNFGRGFTLDIYVQDLRFQSNSNFIDPK